MYKEPACVRGNRLVNYVYSTVFYEQLRDIKMMSLQDDITIIMQINTAHEIMHQCEVHEHSTGPYIMNQQLEESYIHFEPAHIAFVRGISDP